MEPLRKRKLLVISYFFAPKRAIASVRWSKLAKYITARCWDVDVLTTSTVDKVDRMLAADIDRMGNIIFIDHADRRLAPSGEQRKTLRSILDGTYTPPAAEKKPTANRSEAKGFSALKARLSGSAPFRLYGRLVTASLDRRRSRDFASRAEQYIREHGGLDKYDAVISTFGPVGDVLLALRLKKLYPGTPLIMDFRDPMDSKGYSAGVRRRMRRLEKQACHAADAVCAVSEGTALKISESSDKKIDVITNGYDCEDLSDSTTPRPSDRFTLCYTGNIYTELDDFTPLWRCLREMADSGDIDLAKTSFVFAGRQTDYLTKDMAAYGLDGILESHGVVDREEALSLQNSADGLVVCVWNTKDSQGILSGKLFEYMLIRKPIIALVGGDLGHSEMRSIIESGSMGVVYEHAFADADRDTLREYILRLYNEKINGVPSGYAPDDSAVKSYDYSVLAERYMELIDEVCGRAARR